MSDRDFWLAIREALLRFIDAIERKWAMLPTTSEIRRRYKQDRPAR